MSPPPSPLESDEVPEAGRCVIAPQEVDNLPINSRNKNSIQRNHHKKHQTTVQNYEAKLDAAWGGRTWLPPPEYSRRKPPLGSQTSTISEKALGHLVQLATLCQDAGIPVQTLYADGGLLFEAAVELHGRDSLRWTTEVPKKAIELFNTSVAPKKVDESGQTVNAATHPAPSAPVESCTSLSGGQSENKSADLDGQTVDIDTADDSAGNRVVVDLETEPDAGSSKECNNTSVTVDLHDAITRLESGQMLRDNCMDALQSTILRAFPQSGFGIVHPLYFRPAATKLPHHLPRAFNGRRKAKFLAAVHHNCHWVLAIFSVEEGRIELWDPIPGSGALDTVKRAAVPWFEKMVNKSPVHISILIGPKQDDGVSCGVFVLLAMKHILEGHDTLENLRIAGPEARATLSRLAHDELSLRQNATAADTHPAPTRKRRSSREPVGPSPVTKRRNASAPDAALEPCAQDNESTVNESTVNESTVNESTVNDSTVNDPTVNDPTVNDPTVNDPTVNDSTVNDPTVKVSTGNGSAISINEIFASMEALGKPCDRSMSSATLAVQRHQESLQTAIQHREEVFKRLQTLEQQPQGIAVDFAGVEADRKRTRNWSEQRSADGVRFRVPDDSSTMEMKKTTPALTHAEGHGSLTDESLPAARAELEMADVAIQTIKQRLQDAEKKVLGHQIQADFWQMMNS